MPFSLRRDSDTRPSQKSSQIAPCFFRSIRTPTLRPFSSVTNWMPLMAPLSLSACVGTFHPDCIRQHTSRVREKLFRVTTIVGIGEALFDIFPTGARKLGGAPLNFAVHANQLVRALGGRGVAVSRVGTDDLGEGALQRL